MEANLQSIQRTPIILAKKAEGPAAYRLSARERRAFNALWHSSGWVTREEMDRIVGTSNSPSVTSTLRHRKGLGRDGIETERFNVLDRDGNTCRPGRYRLTGLGRERAVALDLVEPGR